MGINQIAVSAVRLPDHPLGFPVVAAVALEALLQLVLNPVAHLIPAHIAEPGHVVLHLRRVPGEGVEQPLQIGGDENIHRGGHGVVERPVPVVDAGAQEVGEHIVAVGGADQLVDGQAHFAGVESGQNIAEIAGRHTDIYTLTGGNLFVPQQVAVGRDIVDDLRQDPAPVDGVGRGEEVAPARQLPAEPLVGEEPLYAGLGVVEVAHHGGYPHVAPLLGYHLQLLDLGNPVLRVEHQNFSPGHILKALQGPFARVAGGGHQNAGRLVLLCLHQGGGQQVGQHLQGHVLKGAGGAVPQLQTVGIAVQRVYRSHRRRVKFVRSVGGVRVVGKLLDGELLQKHLHNVHRPLLIGHGFDVLQRLAGQLGDIIGRQQAAVLGQSLGDGLGGGILHRSVPCTDIAHS